MIEYRSFQYIYPPRPKNPIHHSDLKMWEDNSMIAQPKINGSNCSIYLNGKDMFVYNRHGQRMSGFDITKDEIYSLYKGNGWLVLNGEYTNKGKLDADGKSFSNKFCLFDILVKDNQYLVGQTFKQRFDLIGELYGESKNYLNQISNSLYIVGNYCNDFENHYNNLIEIDLIEGLVLKRKNAKLEVGSTELNNHKSQIKVRKPTKNYKF